MKKGYYRTVIRVKEDAEPIDNITKFAWCNDDYETVNEFVEYTNEELKEMAIRESLSSDNIIGEQDDAICALYEENLSLKKIIADIDDAICCLHEQMLEVSNGKQSNT